MRWTAITCCLSLDDLRASDVWKMKIFSASDPVLFFPNMFNIAVASQEFSRSFTRKCAPKFLDWPGFFKIVESCCAVPLTSVYHSQDLSHRARTQIALASRKWFLQKNPILSQIFSKVSKNVFVVLQKTPCFRLLGNQGNAKARTFRCFLEKVRI